MATPRKPHFDWDAARAFYVALGPQERTYRRVAAEFSVSETSVKRWAKRQDWPAVAAAADAQVAEKAMARVVRTRTQRVEKYLGFVDRYVDTADTKLVAGDLEVRAGDLPGLVKTAELLVGEPTDRIQISALQPLLDAYDEALEALRELAPDQGRADAIMGRLDEALLAIAAQHRDREPLAA